MMKKEPVKMKTKQGMKRSLQNMAEKKDKEYYTTSVAKICNAIDVV